MIITDPCPQPFAPWPYPRVPIPGRDALHGVVAEMKKGISTITFEIIYSSSELSVREGCYVYIASWALVYYL